MTDNKILKIKWKALPELLERPIIEWIDLCNGTMFRITAFFVKNAWYYPREGFFVGIENIGSFLFSVHTEKSWEYVHEKFRIMQPRDSMAIADWINAQCGFDSKQQGIYERCYVTADKTYHLIGEHSQEMLKPDIIEGD